MAETGDLRKWGVDMFALQHFSQDPPDIPNGQLLIDGEPYVPGGGGGGGDYEHPNHTGDVTSVGDGATTIANNVVSNAKLADMATATLKGRTSSGTGDPEDLSVTAVRTLLNVADGANNYSHPNHTGDVTSVADGATTIANDAVTTAKIINDAVTNTKLANMAQATVKGRASGAGTGDPADLTATELRTLLNVADGANNYSHPNHTGDVTSAGDGATTIASAAVTNAKLADMSQYRIKGRVSSGSGAPEDLTPLQMRPFIWRKGSTTSSATPSFSYDDYNYYGITALAVDLTSLTVTGTPSEGDLLWVYIIGTATRTLALGSGFEASTIALPTTTDGTNRLDLGFVYNSATSKWRLVAMA